VLLANAVAGLHAAAVLFMLTGSLLALRRPWVLWLHVPVALTILALYATGSDCPLTTWELALRDGAGEPGYRGGFIGHYITEPLGFPIEAASTQLGILAVAFLPNLVGYGLLAARLTRRDAGGRARPAARPGLLVPASRRSPPRPPSRSEPGPGRSPGDRGLPP
jgi:Protein of Unknown function (DUF2784)